MKTQNETQWLGLGTLMAVLVWAPACDESEDRSPTGGMPMLGTSATASSESDGGGDGDTGDDAMDDDDGGGGGGGGNDDNGEPSDDEGSTGAQDDPSETSGDDDAGSSGSDGDDAGEPMDPQMPGPLQECLDTAADSCQECGCNSCLEQFNACELDIGCVAIRICAENAMCSDVDCIGPCGDVINNNGGPFGEPLAKLMALGDCMDVACDGCLG